MHILYRFRFATTDHIAAYLGKPNGTRVYRRLMTLVEQGYVGRNFEPEFWKKEKKATYYLLPKSFPELRKRQDKTYSDKVFRSLYRDATVSEQFIEDNLAVFETYCCLKAHYGDDLQFFTRSDLANFDTAHFPQPLPDAYLRLKVGGKTKQFFLDVHSADQPFFKLPKRVRRYAVHAESQAWQKTGEELPNILALCDKPATQSRLQKNIAKHKTPDTHFFSAIKGALGDLATDTNVWHPQAKLDNLTSLEAA